jgi:polysaccharide biosynthesis/export protein
MFILVSFASSNWPLSTGAQVPDSLAGANAGSVTSTRVFSFASSSLPVLGGYVPDDKYRLRAGDKVSFQILEDRIFDEKDLPRSLTVADSGELDVPYIGRIGASDKTCKQLGEEIKALLENDYYYQASVVLALDVANKALGRVYVWGQVRTQGAIDIAVNEKLTAGKAILRAGGFADFANKKKVKVVRGGKSEAAAKQTFQVNMIEILEAGKPELDVALEPDDFILVPSRLINF